MSQWETVVLNIPDKIKDECNMQQNAILNILDFLFQKINWHS